MAAITPVAWDDRGRAIARLVATVETHRFEVLTNGRFVARFSLDRSAFAPVEHSHGFADLTDAAVLPRSWAEVVSATTTAPPADPVSGALYLVGQGATGTWVGLDGALVVWAADGDPPSWLTVPTVEGRVVRAADTGALHRHTDGVWTIVGEPILIRDGG